MTLFGGLTDRELQYLIDCVENRVPPINEQHLAVVVLKLLHKDKEGRK